MPDESAAPSGLTAVTVNSSCSGCAMTICSPEMTTLMAMTYGKPERLPVFRFADFPHPGCEGGGTYQRLVPILTVYEPVPAKKRWWRRA